MCLLLRARDFSLSSSLIHSTLVGVNNFIYLKFNSHLLVIGGGSQEMKAEQRSEKSSVTPVGGRSQCGTQQGKGSEDRGKFGILF